MAIDWQHLPEQPHADLPYNGDQVLLAIQNLVAGGGLDPDCPFSLHLACWDDERREWATNETDDDNYGILWLTATAPTFWAEIDLPY